MLRRNTTIFLSAMMCAASTQSFAQISTHLPKQVQTKTPPSIQDTEITSEQEPWQVCNETSYILDVATAYIPKGELGAPLSVKGWLSVRPGGCQIIDAEKGTPRFVYARSAHVHQGGIREWAGSIPYCVDDEDFSAKTGIACDLQNMTSAGFLQILPTERRTAFTEPQDFGRLAQTAGLQRLLQDNNYDIKIIDGRDGRLTNKLLKKFLKDKKLKPNLDDTEKFAALEKFAKKTRATIGVTICNKSTAKVWVALAYREEEDYDARGWWSINKGVCIQPYSENLTDKDMHFYARQESKKRTTQTNPTSTQAQTQEEVTTDNILMVAKNKGKSFCIGASKFSALAHEYCQDQGYVAVNFRPVEPKKVGVEITLRDEDFTKALISALR